MKRDGGRNPKSKHPRKGDISIGLHSTPTRSSETLLPWINTKNPWPVLLICVALTFMVWIAFGQSTQYGFVNFDDDVYVYENEWVSNGLRADGIKQAFTSPHASNWHPVTTLSHLCDCQLFGLDAREHHRTNVLLHAAASVILFLVLLNLTQQSWASAFAVALFAVHPLRVESVAWIAERKDVLSGLFFALALGAYARYARRPFSWQRYGLVLVTFGLGLLCKPMLVTVPFVFLLLDWWPLRRLEFQMTSERTTFLRLLVEKLPFILLAVASSIVTLQVQQTAVQLAQHWSLPVRVNNAIAAYVAYIGQMIWPAELAVLYPHPGNQLSGRLVSLAALGLAVVSVWLVRQKQKPYLLVGWLWYLGMLVPVIGIIQVGQQARADRYTYLPQIGLCIMVAWSLKAFASRFRHGRLAASVLASVILASLIWRSRDQTRVWQDSISLWEHALAVTPKNPAAHLNLARELARLGDLDASIHHYGITLQQRPDDAEAHASLGAVLTGQGKLADAISHCERALQLNPELAPAHYNIGIAFAYRQEFDRAVDHFERAVKFKPDYAAAHLNLGNALNRQGKLAEAVQHFQTAVRLKPEWIEARLSLGNGLARLQQWDQAVEQFERALQLEPKCAEAYYGLGSCLVTQGRSAEAKPQFEQALMLATAQGNQDLIVRVRTQLQVQSTLPKP
jgi:tetratricopeptide (TPR) repeat protein